MTNFKRQNAVRLYLFSLVFFMINTVHGGSIVFPWNASNALVKVEDNFEIWFIAESNETIESIGLKGPYNTVEIPSENFTINSGSWVYDEGSGNTYNTRIEVTIPADAPSERYDLVIAGSDGETISKASVKVEESILSEYYIFHLSDQHLYQGGENTIAILQRTSTLVDIANIIDPLVVMNTGDVVYGDSWDRVNGYFEGIEEEDIKGAYDFTSATFTMAGNHDPHEGGFDNIAKKSAYWNKYFGLQAFNVAFGNSRFILTNGGWGTYDQATPAQEWIQSVGDGTIKINGSHIKDGRVQPIDDAVDLDLIMVGHNHYIAGDNPHPLSGKPIQFVATSLRDHAPEFNLFKIDAGAGTFTPVSGPTAQVFAIDPVSNIDNVDSFNPRLTLDYADINDGTQTINTATLTNRFSFDIQQAKVRFVMNKGNYGVDKGRIQQIIEGDNLSVYDIKIDLDANSTTEIQIREDLAANIKHKLELERNISVRATKNGVQIKIDLPTSVLLKTTLHTIHGKHLESSESLKLSQGFHSLSSQALGFQSLYSGLYLVRVEVSAVNGSNPQTRSTQIFIP